VVARRIPPGLLFAGVIYRYLDIIVDAFRPLQYPGSFLSTFDILDSGDKSDTLLGGEGNDRLYGGNGDDYLDGGEGNDEIDGGNGDDYLDGGSGNNTLIGEAGADTFVISKEDQGRDTIKDFTLGEDSIKLTGGLSASGLQLHHGPEGTSIEIGEYSVTLLDIDVSHFGEYGLYSILSGNDITACSGNR